MITTDTRGLEVVEAAPTRVAALRRIVRETPDTATYWLSFLDAEDRAMYRFQPGQFNMLYFPGHGEVPISISSDPFRRNRLAHSVRATGRVTNLIKNLTVGSEIGVRGPFGQGWPMCEALNEDLLIVAGGLGLAPVRPAIYEAIRVRESFRRVMVLVGARSPEHVLYRKELDAWGHFMRHRGIEVGLTVEVPDDAWPYGVGVVTALYGAARLDPGRTTAFVCGPELMMRFAASGLTNRGIPPDRIWISMERNMQCAVRLCGHCQFGPKFVCADGPVFRYDEVAALLEVHEL
jgi:NAD(P)H-flavin reductase